MSEVNPIMRAWREFAMADPGNCDKEWAAYLALVQKKETASISSPMNSTMPLHDRVHGLAVVLASTPMRSTASPRALSSTVSTDNFHEPAAATSSPTSAPTIARSTAASIRAATSTRVPSTAPLDSTLTSVLSSSTATALTTTFTSCAVPCTKHDLAPEARRIYDYLVGDSAALAPAASEVSAMLPEVSTVLRGPTALSVASMAVDINAIDLAVTVPTDCSSKCPSCEVTVLVSDTISSAKPSSSMTTGTDLSESAAAVVGDMALDLVAAGHTSSTASLATISTGVIALDVEDNLVTAELQVGTDVFRTNPVPSRGLDCPVTASNLNLNIKQQGQLWSPPNRAFRWKLCANERPLSEEEEFSENSMVFLLWDTTQLQSWPPPPSMHGFVTAREKNRWLHSWLELLLFEHDCPLEASFDYHITGACLKQFMRIPVLWQFMRKWKFKGNEKYSVQSTTSGNIITDHAAMIHVTVLVGAAIVVASNSVGLDWKLSIVRVLKLSAIHKMFPVVLNVSPLVPGPPPIYNRAGPTLINGQYSIHHGQQKRGKYVLLVWVLRSSLPPPLQYFPDSQRKWDTNLLDKREDRQQSERRKVAKLKPPWPHVFGMCMKLPMSTLPNSPGRVIIIFVCTDSVLRYLNEGNSIDEPKPPWPLLDTTISTSELTLMTFSASMHITISYLELIQFGSGLFELQLPWYVAWLLAEPSCAEPKIDRGGTVPIRGLNFCTYPMPLVNQMILNLNHILSTGNLIEVNLLNDVLVQYWLLCLNGHIIQYSSRVNQWMIAWWSDMQYSSGGNKFAQLSSAKILQVSVADCTRSYPTATAGSHYLLSRKMCPTTFHLHAYVARWNFYRMKLGCKLFEMQYFGIHGNVLMQIAVKTRGLQPTKILCCSLLIHLPAVLATVLLVGERVHFAEPILLGILSLTRRVDLSPSQFDGVHFLHLPQVVPRRVRLMFVLVDNFLENSSMCATHVWRQGNPRIVDDVCYWPGIDTSQVPWDPGGSLRYRLGDKPIFNGGGLSATILLNTWAGWWADTIGPWPAQKLGEISTSTEEGTTKRAAWNGRTERRLRPRLALAWKRR